MQKHFVLHLDAIALRCMQSHLVRLASGDLMTTLSRPKRYSSIAVLIHWLMAPSIACTFLLGWYMHDLPISPSRIRLFNWHKWAGMTGRLLHW